MKSRPYFLVERALCQRIVNAPRQRSATSDLHSLSLRAKLGASKQGANVKSIFDSSFKYKPSFDTDVRRTFQRVRRVQQALDRRTAKVGANDGSSVVRRSICSGN